jgi:hypothetical protein
VVYVTKIVETLKTEYNKVLQRWDKATKFLEGEATAEEIDKWLPDYEKILKQRNALIMDIWEYSKAKPTLAEYEGGFQ